MPKLVRTGSGHEKQASPVGKNPTKQVPSPIEVFEDLTCAAGHFDTMIADWIDEIRENLADHDSSELSLGGINPRELVFSLIQWSLVDDSDFEYPEDLAALMAACAHAKRVSLTEFDDPDDGETYVEVTLGDTTLGKALLETFFDGWPARASHWLLWRTGADVEVLKKAIRPILPDWSRKALG